MLGRARGQGEVSTGKPLRLSGRMGGPEMGASEEGSPSWPVGVGAVRRRRRVRSEVLGQTEAARGILRAELSQMAK